MLVVLDQISISRAVVFPKLTHHRYTALYCGLSRGRSTILFLSRMLLLQWLKDAPFNTSLSLIRRRLITSTWRSRRDSAINTTSLTSSDVERNLLEAASSGDIDTVEEIRDYVNEILDKRDAALDKEYKDMMDCVDSVHKRTPLIWAVINGHEKVVDFLLSSDADHGVSDIYGKTALIYAEDNNDIRELLKSFGAELPEDEVKEIEE